MIETNLKEAQTIHLKAGSELAVQAKAQAKTEALKVLQDSDEFFLLAKKGSELESQVLVTNHEWIMQGFCQFLTQALPESAKPLIDKFSFSLGLLALVIHREADRKEAQS
jgi:hypothetical protein